MDLELTVYLIVCPLVFLGGFVDSIAGGGGLITLPALLLAGLPMHNALATNKMSAFIGLSVSVFRYWRNSLVNVLFILPSVLAAITGAYFGARLALLVDEAYLQYMLIGVLPAAAFIVLKRKSMDSPTGKEMSSRRACILATIISLVVGTYDGFYGPGTGTFLILLFTSVAGMDVRTASGNAKFVNFASNFGAFIIFVFSGKMLITLGLVAAVFSMAGNWLGSGLAIRKGSAVVRPVVLVVLALLFVKVVVNGG